MNYKVGDIIYLIKDIKELTPAYPAIFSCLKIVNMYTYQKSIYPIEAIEFEKKDNSDLDFFSYKRSNPTYFLKYDEVLSEKQFKLKKILGLL